MSLKIEIIICLVILTALAIYLAYFYKAKEYSKSKLDCLKGMDFKIAHLNNYEANYIKKGKGKKLILVHGGGSWSYSWRNNIDELAKEYEVYAVDMPGHGYTFSKKNVKYDLDTFSEFIDDFMSKLNIEKASLIGSSWGGGFCLYYCLKHPDKIDKLVLIDSSGLNEPDKSEWRFLNYPVLGEIISKFITLNATEKSLKNMFYDKGKIRSIDAEVIYLPLSKNENREAQVKAQRNLKWSLVDDNIDHIKKKTLLIFGDSDPYFDKSYADKINEKMSNSHLIIIEKAGHLPHEEKPLVVNKLILDFLK